MKTLKPAAEPVERAKRNQTEIPLSQASALRQGLLENALRKHLSDAMVRSKACYLLAMLCTDAGVTASITTSGATELALAALTHQHADAYGRYTAALLLDVMVGKPSGFRGHW
jgi:hypothetical protein